MIATSELDTVADVVADGVTIRGRKVAVKEPSTREIKAVASQARPERADPAAQQARAAARALQARARARGAKHAKVEVEVEAEVELRKGAPWETLTAPLAELEALVARR